MLWIIILIIIGFFAFGFLQVFWKVILCTILGSLIGGPVGGIIGFIVGVFLQSKSNKNFAENNSIDGSNTDYDSNNQQQSTITVLEPVIRLVCYFILHKDRNWTSEKVAFVKDIFKNDCETSDDMEFLKNIIKEKQMNKDYWVSRLNQLQLDYQLKLKVFEMCATALNFNEYRERDIANILEKFGTELRLNYDDIQQVIFLYQSKNNYDQNNHQSNPQQHLSILQSAYSTLDLPVGSTKEEVIKAYRKKMMQYHPDKNPNVTEAVQEMLNIKSREIQNAKELILSHLT